MNYYETQYLAIVKDILDNGVDRSDRTGIGSRAVWHKSMSVDLNDGFPILTSRKIALRIAFEEMMFFLRGETDTKKLESKNINIWKGNTSREFLDNRGLHNLPEGDMGKGYGWQLRNFGGTDSVSGIDQLAYILNLAKNNPNDRRMIMSYWNPNQLNEAALVPCHTDYQIGILDGKLNAAFSMRSVDQIYGNCYNFMAYAFLTHIIAKYLKLNVGILGYTGKDVHIYLNQLDIAKEQITRPLFELPTFRINKDINSIDDILSTEFCDIELINYHSHPDFKNKPPMAI